MALDLNHKLHYVNSKWQDRQINLFTSSSDCKADLLNQNIDNKHYICVNTVDGVRYCPLSLVSGGLAVNTSDGIRYAHNKKFNIEVYASHTLEDTSDGYGLSFDEKMTITSYNLNCALEYDIVIKIYDKDKNYKFERKIPKGVTKVSTSDTFNQSYSDSTSGVFYFKVYSPTSYVSQSLECHSRASAGAIVIGFIDMKTDIILDNSDFLDFSKDEFYQVINGMELKGNMNKNANGFHCEASPPQVAGLWWYNMQSKIKIRNSDKAIASGIPEYNTYTGDWTLYIPFGTGIGGGEGNFNWTVKRYTGAQKDLTNQYHGSSKYHQSFLATATLDNL